ncbi:MAG: hypothetical protein ACLQKK_07200 [Rhodomicrobium sp.]
MSFVETLALYQTCRGELDRLHNVLAAFKAFDEAWVTAAPLKTEIRQDEAMLRRTSIRTLSERAKDTRAFAKQVNDAEVKRLLLKLAVSYEEIAEAAKADDRICA